jgi:hypothetical protein
MEGTCAVCGQVGKLSFEHVPPQSAFNNKPIYMYNELNFDERAKEMGRRKKSNKGFGSYTLCEPCNNNTGNWYAKDFGSFAQQGMDAVKSSDSRAIQHIYTIKPLNVFKQIMTMFMSADKSGHLRSKQALVDFILNRTSNEFPEEFKIHIYSNASPVKRMLGYCVVYDPRLGVQKWSEINFQPFGYFLTENSKPASEFMVDITPWSELPYGHSVNVKMITAYLKVSTPIIGMYE